jgi:hypothetical protein
MQDCGFRETGEGLPALDTTGKICFPDTARQQCCVKKHIVNMPRILYNKPSLTQSNARFTPFLCLTSLFPFCKVLAAALGMWPYHIYREAQQ